MVLTSRLRMQLSFPEGEVGITIWGIAYTSGSQTVVRGGIAE